MAMAKTERLNMLDSKIESGGEDPLVMVWLPKTFPGSSCYAQLYESHRRALEAFDGRTYHVKYLLRAIKDIIGEETGMPILALWYSITSGSQSDLSRIYNSYESYESWN